MFAELPGQELIIFNDTDEKIKDLSFYLPGTEIIYKAKKLLPNSKNREHIYDGYAGDLTFFFRSHPEIKFNFPNAIDGKNKGNSTSYFMAFHINYNQDHTLDIIMDKDYQDNEDRTIL